MGPVEDAVIERARGGQPSRVKALMAAAVVGFAAATLTFRLLRSGAGSGEAAEGSE